MLELPAIGRINIPKSVQRELLDCLEYARGREACGLLLGSITHHVAHVELAVATINADRGQGRFAIPCHEAKRVERMARARELNMIGVYHSHPTGSTELSNDDELSLRHGRFPWVVVTKAHDGSLQLQGYSARSCRPIPIDVPAVSHSSDQRPDS